MRNIDTQLLRTFRTTAATGNMTQASNILNLSQGAVSQQIRKLEDLFGNPLFQRNKSGLTLTAAGEKLFFKAQKLLALNDEIWRDMTQSEFEGIISLGIPLDLMGGNLPNILRLFAENYPHIDINLVCAPTLDLQQQLKEGHLDITLMEELPEKLTGEVLFSDKLVWIGARGGNAYQQSPLPLSIASNACVFRKPAMAALDAIDRPWKRVYESTNLDAILAMIRMDLAVGAYLATLIPDTLEQIPFGPQFPPLPEFHITLTIATGPRQEISQILADYIRSGFRSKKTA